jgi:hypothetical protein
VIFILTTCCYSSPPLFLYHIRALIPLYNFANIYFPSLPHISSPFLLLYTTSYFTSRDIVYRFIWILFIRQRLKLTSDRIIATPHAVEVSVTQTLSHADPSTPGFIQLFLNFSLCPCVQYIAV